VEEVLKTKKEIDFGSALGGSCSYRVKKFSDFHVTCGILILSLSQDIKRADAVLLFSQLL